jgi:uncharacterized membrane protein
MDKAIQLNIKYGFAFILMAAGIILSYLNIGQEFLGFTSVGNWLIYIGLVMIGAITLRFFSGKVRKVDERIILISQKASRMTFLLIVLVAFIVMVIDGLYPIRLSYSLFMSYLICFITLAYLISYKLLERKY